MLDRLALAAVTEQRRDGLLLVEGEAIAAPPRVRVEQVADAKELLGRREDLGGLARDQRADAHQLLRLAHAEAGLGGPAGDVQIAQPPLPVLHVGLEQVHRPTEARVPLGGLVFEAREEARELGVGEEPLLAALAQELREPAIPGDMPPVEEAGRRREIGLRFVDEVVDGDDLVANADPHVPERIEQRVGHRRGLVDVAREEADIEVTLERDRAPAIAAHPGEGHVVPGARRYGAHGVDGDRAGAEALEERGEQLVEDGGVAAAEGHAEELGGDGRVR